MMQKRTKLRLVSGLLSAACLAFIWINSSLPGDESSHLSEWLLGFLPFMEKLFGAYAERILRKAAHFSEFAGLAFLLSIFFSTFLSKALRSRAVPAFTGLLAACVDETIQIFSEGRSSSLIDVWIDFGGVCTGILVFLLLTHILPPSRN